MPDGYRTVELARFGGLDLRRDPQEDAGGVRAIDMRNINLAEDGRIKARPGTRKIYSHSSAILHYRLYAYQTNTVGSSSVLVTIDENLARLYAYNATTGGAITNFLPPGAATPGDLLSAVQIGVPGTAGGVMYLGVKGATNLVKFDGTTFTSIAAAGPGAYMAVQYPDNRLVAAWEYTTAFPSRVSFSNANNPEVYGASDYVDLLPGDGERIVGMCNWRNYVFVFKQSTFFRFYGNSADATGGAVFNYDSYRHGLSTPYVQGVNMCCAGSEGVYFLTKRGIYLTDGGPPRKISDALDPLFVTGDYTGFFSRVSAIHSSGMLPTALRYIDGRLWLVTRHSSTVTATTTAHAFVYDPALNSWMYWGILNSRGSSINGLAGVTGITGRETPHFSIRTNVSGSTFRSIISALDPSFYLDEDHDAFVTINAQYRTNFLDLGDADAMKKVRAIVFDGYLNNTTLNAYLNDQVDVLGITGAALTTDPSGGLWPDYRIGQAVLRRAMRGRNFSLELTGIGPGWVLNRAVLQMLNQRPVGVRA